MDTLAAVAELPLSDGPRLPVELLVCIAEFLLQDKQYGTYEALVLSSKSTKDALALSRKRFAVVRGDGVAGLGNFALAPGTEQIG
jgi:hypothetical protein